MAWSRWRRGKSGNGESAQQMAARRAQLALASLAPLVWTYTDREYDLDHVVGEAIEQSAKVYKAVEELFTALEPDHPLHTTAIAAGRAAADLSLTSESWADFCAQHSLPGQDEPATAMDREWPDPSVLRAWPRYEVARARTQGAIEVLAELQSRLTQYTGHNVPAAWHAA
ncbi:hypothetical protein [Streptomyces bluensis]|uniref:hypothetical protein n=1 Tax=Streptomyces bluensis TaxID=33897 RepID=UPI001671D716|nr:hypothetical protein [Streptomyces bluensis]